MALDNWKQDISYAVRMLRRDRLFLVAAVLIIALGIGANTAIFSVVHGILFRPLPFHSPERLVWIANDGTGPGLSGLTSRVSTFNEWRRSTQTMEDIAAYFAFFDYGSYTMIGSGEPRQLSGVGITQNLLPFLGVQPALGRNFTVDEGKDGAPMAIILTHGLWQSQFGGERSVIGQKVNLNGKPASVVGVLPANFDFSGVFVPGSRVDMLVPFPLSERTDRWGNTLAVIGRLKPGLTLGAARAEFEAINEGLRRSDPGRWRFGSRLTSLHDYLTGRFRTGLLILLCAVGGVLLIACTNLSNLLLARGTARRREVAIRSALGATRWRLIRQMLTESIILSGAGALVGLSLAWIAVRYLSTLKGIDMPLLRTVTLDQTALLFTAAVTIVTGVLFGIVPAIHASGNRQADTLKDTSRGTSGSKRAGWTQNALVVSEVALACVLLIGAGLLIRSFVEVLRINMGFQPEHAMAWRVTAGEQRKDTNQQKAFYDRIVDAVQAIPGVVSAGVTDALPLSRDRSWGLAARGVTYERDRYPIAHPRIIDWRYLKTMSIPLRAGRDFSAHDTAESEKVIIINERAAKLLWPNQNPIGQMARFDTERRVVGVVGNVRHLSVEQEGGNEAYIPISQNGSNTMDLVVRSTLPASGLIPAVVRALTSVDSAMPTGEFQQLGELVDRSVSPRRFMTSLLGVFAITALVLAILGIYGVVAYTVGQRRPEIGIRLALGASPGDVQRRIVMETGLLVGSGLVIGLVAAFVLTRVASSLLYNVGTTDPLTFLATSGALLGAALIASWLPALRASRLNPMSVLRVE